MPDDCISYRETGFFSKLICDYLDKDQAVLPFFDLYPNLENFETLINAKKASFPSDSRRVLAKSLREQYEGFSMSESVRGNIELLQNSNTFTITTGHQLNLFTGPLYFLYKIISVINLTKILKKNYPNNNFVPIYWMATEDHDFEEINFFNFKGKKIRWDKKASGAVGELTTEDINKLFDVFSQEIGEGTNADELRSLFKQSYLEGDNLSGATRNLVNNLFAEYGLVILDANNKDLKRLFIPFAKEELVENISFKEVSKTSSYLLQKGFKVQVNPREINLFYLDKNIRERIVKNENNYEVLNTNLSFTSSDILAKLESDPQQFSPNVILRPLYQEVILPNLCYIGGGGELAYWLQLKDMFSAFKIPFPALKLRNSVLLLPEKVDNKLKKLNIDYNQLFLDRPSFINRKIREISDIDIDLSVQKERLKEQFTSLFELAQKTDQSFIGAVKAQEKKQINGLNKLEKRLLLAQKRKLKDEVVRVSELHDGLFPGGNLQERTLNFSEMYLRSGRGIIPFLQDKINPLNDCFLILVLR